MTSKIVWAEGEDEALAAASEHARKTFRYFWREVAWERRRIVKALDLAVVKAAFTDGVATEHMWIADVAFDGRTVRGQLINTPNEITTVAAGDVVEVPLGEVEDWMYSYGDDGAAYGGFTVQALRARMDDADRDAHDGAWGLDFGDPEAPRLTSFEPADGEHPMSRNMAASLRAYLAQNPRVVSSADANGFTMLHDLALAGSEDGVRVVLERGADRSAKTNLGHTPRDLAALFDWTRVLALLDG